MTAILLLLVVGAMLLKRNPILGLLIVMLSAFYLVAISVFGDTIGPIIFAATGLGITILLFVFISSEKAERKSVSLAELEQRQGTPAERGWEAARDRQ